ncbi:ABC transporter substrate-binding protein [Cupriavidus oxalaticus]|uniref:ABC transporter substrate-binding protein n=1 Tax=Cupriavidus oxalaticus TaxID=96344 RepID=UPI003F741DF4
MKRIRKSLAGLSILCGCISPIVAEAKPADGTLVAAVAREILVLDNFNATSRENEILSLLIDDSLFYIDPATQQPTPLLAKSYRYLEPTVLEVTLREDVQFHDGSKVTADDVVYTFQSVINPKSTAKKGDQFTRWLAKVEKGEAPGTVVFRMKGANPLVLHFLATTGRVVKKGTYDKAGTPSGLDVEAQSRRVVGTGPYKVTSFLPGREVVLEKFAGYRKDSPKGTPEIPRIRIKVIPDYATQVAEVLSGGVHWTYNIPTDIADEVASTKQAVFMASPSMRIGFIVLDAAGRTGKDNPFTKLKVRQALNYAVDREALTKQLIRGRSAPALTPCLPIQFGCAQDVAKYSYNLAKAKQLLTEAGYPNGLQFDLWASREKETLEAVVAMWRKAGINANLRVAKSPAVVKARDENQISAYFENNGSLGVADAGALLPNMFGKGSPSDFHHDQRLYSSLEQFLSTTDVAARKQIGHEVVSRILDQAYWVPLFEFTQNFVLAPDLSFPQAADGMPRLYLAKWKAAK